MTFFTIGDKDQSIYGFEKEESMDPNFYYNQLYKTLQPKKMTMSINYRSYPKILEASSYFLPPTSHVPVPCNKRRKRSLGPIMYISMQMNVTGQKTLADIYSGSKDKAYQILRCSSELTMKSIMVTHR